MTLKAKITARALELLNEAPGGLRHSVLINKLISDLPGVNPNTVVGTVVGLANNKPDDIYKPAKGLFKHTKYKESGPVQMPIPPAVPPPPPTGEPKEEDFYQAFADYLTEDLEECTRAVALGGNKFKDKWGTPDVIGVRKARESDIIKFPTEIIVAEVKVDTGNLITAFGQACSYRLFSHRAYIVVPRSANEEDLARLEALCLTCGLGLILFNSACVHSPAFSIRVRAAKSEPDTFYVNRNMKAIEKMLFT